MQRRPRAARSLALAAVALAAAALALAGSGQGAGDSPTRTAARAWHAIFGDRPQAAATPKLRVLVVLAAPSLADRMAAAEERPSSAEQRRFTAEAEGAQRLLLAGLRERGLTVSRDETFTRTFNGFSASVGPRALAELERATSVAGVYPVRTVYPAAAQTPAGAGKGQSAAGLISLPGFDGRGVTVALLDAAVDRSHPALRGHVRRGFDLVAGGRDVASANRPGENGLADTHGTRMAGLVVGAQTGVAPGARILPIRILGWQQTAEGDRALLGRGDVLLAGLELAVDPDRDGDVDDAVPIALAPVVEPYAAFGDSPEARAVAGASRLGTLVVAPAGNDGRPGPGFGSIASPGAAADALTAGALDAREHVLGADIELRAGSDAVLAEPARVLGEIGARDGTLEVTMLAGPTLARPDRPASEQGDGGTLADFFDRSGVSLVAGRAVVLPVSASLRESMRNASAAGAALVLVAGTDLPAGSLDFAENESIPVVALPAPAAEELVAALAAGEPASLSIENAAPVENSSLMDVAAFSSGGIAFDGRVKPDLVAPGVGLATVDPQGSDATVTGTSAAAAVTAGAAALVAQARPGMAPAALKGLLVGSAAQLARGSTPLPVTTQGAGLVEPRRAAAAELAVEPSTLAFGRTDGPGWREARSVIVRNVSSRELTIGFGLTTDGEGEQLSFSAEPTRVTLAPGASAEVAIGVSATGEIEAGAGGALVVSADGAQAARVPWAVARRVSDRAPLVGDLRLSHQEFAPSKAAPVVLAFRAGRVDGTPDGEAIEPVGLLEVELWTADGKRLGVLARLRDVLPGRYAFGLSGRGPGGRVLAEGTYVIRLRAYPVDGDDGARPSTAEAVFTIGR